MNNKEIEYFIDENGNPIKCGFEGTCNNYAVEDFTRGYGKFVPLCKKHLDFLENGFWWYYPDKNGVYHASTVAPSQDSLMFSTSVTVVEQ